MSAVTTLRAIKIRDIEQALNESRNLDPSARATVLKARDVVVACGELDAPTLAALRQAVAAGSKGAM